MYASLHTEITPNIISLLIVKRLCLKLEETSKLVMVSNEEELDVL